MICFLRYWLIALIAVPLPIGGSGASGQAPGDASAIYLYKGTDREARLLAVCLMN